MSSQVLELLKEKLEGGIPSVDLLKRLRGRQRLSKEIVNLIESASRLQSHARAMLAISDQEETLREVTLSIVQDYMKLSGYYRDRVVEKVDQSLDSYEFESHSTVLPETGDMDESGSTHFVE